MSCGTSVKRAAGERKRPRFRENHQEAQSQHFTGDIAASHCDTRVQGAGSQVNTAMRNSEKVSTQQTSANC